MAILHGSWLPKQGGCLFIWGETWRSQQDTDERGYTLTHPLAMTAFELVEWCLQQKITVPHIPTSTGRKRKNATPNELQLPISSQIIAIPTYFPDDANAIEAITPLHSAMVAQTPPQYLQPWKVEGFCLNSKDAVTFITSLPLAASNDANGYLASDLRFWMQVGRWSLDLIARCKFLPFIQQENGEAISKWQVLLDSAVDVTRWEMFSQLMPSACRMYQGNSESTPDSLQINLPSEPQELLLSFLNSTIDAQIRAMVSAVGAGETRLLASLPSAVRQWLHSLTTSAATNELDAGMERLASALNAWTMPLQYQMAGISRFRTCFRLHPPQSEETQWRLEYLLQANDDGEFLVDAATIWDHPVESFEQQNRTIPQPQETFLRGLGLASRLYPPIIQSLETPLPQACNLDPLQAYEFIKSVAWRFEDSGLGVILPPSLANREGWANRLGLKVSAQAPKQTQRLGLQSLLNFKWELAIGGQNISKGEFDKLVALNSPLVQINDEWVELRPQDIKTAQTFFSERQENMSLSLEDALRLSQGDTQTIEKLPVVSFEASGALEDLVINLTNQALEPLPTPADFQGQLRPYQEKGAAWLAFLERWGLGACLADDMGLGKTIQFIAFVLHLKEHDALENPILLVCPTSVLGNWEREIKKFAPTLNVLQYHGDKRPKGKAFANAVKGKDLIITSYALVPRDLKSLQSVTWQILVLDEAQNIKNSETKQSQAIRELDSTFRVALTGTPVENKLQELWSIMDFLNPGYLGNRQFFQRRFAMPIAKYGDTASLTQLRSLVQPFILRRLKTDRNIIQDLPEKQEMNVFCGLTNAQAKLYQQVVDESLAEIDAAEGIQRRGMILSLLVKLKQICNHPSQYLKKTKLDDDNSGKLQRLEAMLEEVIAAGDRALIFTQFAEWGKLLKPYLAKEFDREVLFLYGSTSKKGRQEMVDRFQHDPQGPPVMILSLKAGGVGLNLTRANHVFHFDRWWNPAVENQATDRAFRIGQTRNVQVHKFVATGTLEEKINDMIESKKALVEQVVGTGEEWLTELDSNQLRDLLLLDRNAVIEEE